MLIKELTVQLTNLPKIRICLKSNRDNSHITLKSNTDGANITLSLIALAITFLLLKKTNKLILQWLSFEWG